MQKVLFVPGFPEDLNSRDYAGLLDMFRTKGYDPVFVDIEWQRKTQYDWVKALNEMRQVHGYDAVLAGFSFGAVTALVSAAAANPAELWLFSLSPFFTEDNSTWTASDRKILGSRRIEIASRTSFAQLVPHIGCPVKLFLGEREPLSWPEMSVAFERGLGSLSDAEGYLVEGVGHVVDDRRYIDAIDRVIQFSR